MSDQRNETADPAIRLDHVSKSFGGAQVLKDVSITVRKGESFGLLGRSGTGKSVTLSLMIGLMQADSGAVVIEGKDLRKLNRRDLLESRKHIGFLFQQAALFDSLSVRENVAFPLRRHTNKSEKEIRDAVHHTLESVGLEKDEDKLPAELSGGMRKRVGLARALVLDPPIVMADEPSSGLDVITASEIYELLSKLRERKKTLVIVTHDGMGLANLVDELAVLDQSIIACGKPDELAKSENHLVKELVGARER
ncbi:MAG TPA: ATP-binding cassette domain-containing protein [Bryobacteraceae bacterium]|nr:ATP-binding cassette domain-containing protein [Bryobacteraceae bacterium]